MRAKYAAKLDVQMAGMNFQARHFTEYRRVSDYSCKYSQKAWFIELCEKTYTEILTLPYDYGIILGQGMTCVYFRRILDYNFKLSKFTSIILRSTSLHLKDMLLCNQHSHYYRSLF